MLQEHAAIIGDELNLTKRHVAAVLRLLNDGAAIPFIARYRKEASGAMDNVTIRKVAMRDEALTAIDERKAVIRKAAKEAKALTDELAARINNTNDPTVLDDIYMPFKPRRKTRAMAARAAGYEPLADKIWSQSPDEFSILSAKYTDADISQALDIIAERISENEKARQIVRAKFMRNGNIVSAVIPDKEEEARNFRSYFDFTEPVRMSSPQRYLAMRQGESLGFLRVSISIDDTEMTERLCRLLIRSGCPQDTADLLRRTIADAYKRLLRPSIENEIAAYLKDRADDATISTLSENFEKMLMKEPAVGARVLAIMPGTENGCRLVCLDPNGFPVADDTVYPLQPANDFYGASQALGFLTDRFQTDIIAIADNPLGKQVERFIESLQLPRRFSIVLLPAEPAAAYAATEDAIGEFPGQDPAFLTAVSLGRQVLDPLAELVKTDPANVSLGANQELVNQPRLRRALDFVLKQCVNAVGADLNTASCHFLQHISGIGPALARNIVDFRNEHGPFTGRHQLLDVPRMGEKAFMYAAPFLRIPNSENPLDATAIHPEMYPLLYQIANDLNKSVEALAKNPAPLHTLDTAAYTSRSLSQATLTDMIIALEHPNADPRISEKPAAANAHGASSSLQDFHIGQILRGRVVNITQFGVFVDIGTPQNALIHISQLSDDFIQQPADVVSVGETLTVKILDIDVQRGRIALTLKGLKPDSL